MNTTEFEQEQKRISGLVNDLFEQEKWKQARTLLLKTLKKHPEDHWLLTTISTTYYEERDYHKALDYSNKALKVDPRCPLVIWDHACCLNMVGKKKKAIGFWMKILRRNFSSLAYGDCGEGKRQAEISLNDCRVKIGIAYSSMGKKKEAKKYLLLHLKHRRKGLPAIYTKAEVERILKMIE